MVRFLLAGLLGLLLDAEIPASLGEGAVDAGGRAVHDHPLRPVADQETVDDLLGEFMNVPSPVALDDDTHERILAEKWARGQ
jgi:hypothetical protein